MDVTLKNFDSLLPEIEDAIEKCSFLAIDTELSGLKLTDDSYNCFETVEERYQKEKGSASEFLVLQFGLVPFFYDPDTDVFTHKAYNFYTFPRQAGRHGPNIRFLCESSSMEFLCSFGFDFNKLFYEGIPHLTFSAEQSMREDLEKRKRDHALEEMSNNSNNGQGNNNRISVPEHLKKFMEETESTLKRFVASKKTEYCLENLSAFQRKLIFNNIKPKFGKKLFFETVSDGDSDSSCVSESDSEANNTLGPKSVLSCGKPKTGKQNVVGSHSSDKEKLSGGTNKPDVEKKKYYREKGIRVTKVSEDQLQAMHEEKHRAALDSIDKAVGFSKVIRKISQSEKIVVGHNMLLDIAHTISQFVEVLPDTLAEFKEVVQSAFPNLIDTKLMASTHPFREQITSTVLFDLLKKLHDDPFLLPEIKKVPDECAKGYDFFDEKKHEAGYDAFITGACFIGMCQYLGTQHTPKKPRVLPDSPLVMPFINKIYMMRMLDITYLNISGTDLTPSRSHVFYVTVPREATNKTMHDMFSPFGQVQLYWQNSTSLFVSLNDKDQAPLVMRNIESKPGYGVVPFDQYQKVIIEKKRPLTGESPERSQDESTTKPVTCVETNKSGQKKKRPKTESSNVKSDSKPLVAPFTFDTPPWD